MQLPEQRESHRYKTQFTLSTKLKPIKVQAGFML